MVFFHLHLKYWIVVSFRGAVSFWPRILGDQFARPWDTEGENAHKISEREYQAPQAQIGGIIGGTL
jgi:hypothetical protein